MKNRNLVLGILLIGAGGLWLLNALDIFYFSMNSFIDALRTLWPVALIFIGLGLIIKNKTFEKFLWALFVLLVIGYALLQQIGLPFLNFPNETVANEGPPPSSYGEPIATIDESVITSGVFEAELGGTEFSIDGEGEAGYLFDYYDSLGDVSYDIETNGNQSRLHLQNRQDFMNVNTVSNQNLAVHLNPSLPWTVDLKCGAVSGTADFRSLYIPSLDVHLGAGQLDLYLSEVSEKSEVMIRSGASQINVFLPKDTDIEISFSGALNTTNLKELGWVKNGDIYQNPGYGSQDSTLSIRVEMGLGQIEFHSL